MDRPQTTVVAKNLSVLQLFISRMPKMCAILQLVSATLNPKWEFIKKIFELLSQLSLIFGIDSLTLFLVLSLWMFKNHVKYDKKIASSFWLKTEKYKFSLVVWASARNKQVIPIYGHWYHYLNQLSFFSEMPREQVNLKTWRPSVLSSANNWEGVKGVKSCVE